MRRWAEFFLIASRSTIYRFADQIYALKWYWKFPSFFRLDAHLHWLYAFTNPFKLCRKHWGQGAAMFPYGETPLKTLADIAALAPICSSDTVLDLGCGRGRGVFWLATCVGCRVIGVDAVAEFIRRGEILSKAHHLQDRVSFATGDLLSAPLDLASVIYFYGTGLQESLWIDLAIWLGDLPQFPLVITVSQSLADFSPHFQVLGHCDLEFGWGVTRVYWQRLKATSHVTFPEETKKIEIPAVKSTRGSISGV